MQARQSEELTFRQRLEILVALMSGKPLRPVLDALTNIQLVQAHEFLWNKMVEWHYKTQPQEFRREEVTEKMMGSRDYQKQQNCDLRLDYCKGVECIRAHPLCASNKVKNNMEVMAQHLHELLRKSGLPHAVPADNSVGTSAQLE
jgi:hypothetical protein